MNWLNKTTPVVRYASGFEWKLFKKLHWLWLGGIALLGLAALGIRLWVLYTGQMHQEAWIQKMDFILLGGLLTHIGAMIAITTGCVLVILMKGPNYTADSYPLSDASKPKK